MTNKEQIIIDNVSNFCLVCYYDNKNKELVRIEQYKDSSGDIQTDIESHKYGYNAKIIKPEELIKQLARKTKECEELKDARFNLNCEIYSLNRYRKALEEIEKVINNILNSCLGRNTVSCRPAHNVCGDLIKILDIINKAKDGD